MNPHTDSGPPSDGVSPWLVAWTLAAVAMLGVGLGVPALIEPDEGRNAAIAAGMVSSGDLVVPRLEGLPYLDKPFLFFALIAGSLELFGHSEVAVRLPALVSAWLTVALVWWFGTRWLGRRRGVVAALATATTPLFVAFARTAIFDATLCLLITASLIGLFCAVEGDDSRPESDPERRARAVPLRRRWLYGAWLAMALGVLTKGPVALAVPLLVAVPWAVWRRRAGRIASPGALLVFAAVVAPWVIAVEVEEPGFLRYVAVTETWERLTSDALERAEPWWFFVPFVAAGFFPWSALALSARCGRAGGAAPDSRRSLVLFLALWAVLPFLLFSLSRSKQPQYVLPLVPAFALLAAAGWGEGGDRRGAVAGALGWILLAVPLMLVGLEVVPVDTRVDAETSAGIFRTGILLAVAALLGAGATLLLLVAVRAGARRGDLALMALTLPMLLFPWIVGDSLREIAEIRSSRGMARALALRMEAGDRLIGIESYSPTLSFYLGRPILVSTRDGAPFRSNYVIHEYRRLVARADAALQPPGWWRTALADCSGSDFFVLDRRWSQARAELEAAGLAPFHEAFRLLAYGPCEKVSR
ncbi:MAG TPA: glycosyltransferase family 39 protein [Thermoanaerobaculia bacterium]|nr:glycosyltransferase family 39 protein [Thermoanaerobaculia bacterium]